MVAERRVLGGGSGSAVEPAPALGTCREVFVKHSFGIRDLVKKSRRFKFDEVRQKFRLTPTEKRVAVFIIAAFVLGLVTKCYREAHPQIPKPVEKRHSAAGKTQR